MTDAIQPANDLAAQQRDLPAEPKAKQLVEHIQKEIGDIRAQAKTLADAGVRDAVAKLDTLTNPDVVEALQRVAGWEEDLNLLFNGKDGKGSLADRLGSLEQSIDMIDTEPKQNSFGVDHRQFCFDMFRSEAAENPTLRSSIAVDPRLTDDYQRSAAAYLRGGEGSLPTDSPHRKVLGRGQNFVKRGWNLKPEEVDAFYTEEAQNALSTDWAPGGGIFVTPTQEERIISKVQEGAALLELSSVKSTTSNRHEFTLATGRKPDVNQRGEREGVTLNGETTFWEKRGIDIHEDHSRVVLTRAQIEDSGRDIVREIELLAVDEFQEKMSTKVWKGVGQNEAQGLLNDNRVQIITTGTADTLPLFRLMQAHVDIKPKFLPNAAYILSIGALMSAVLEHDGIGRPLWQPSLPDGTPSLFNGFRWYRDAFLDRELAVTDSAVTFATGSKVVTFGDHAQAYWQVLRRGLAVTRDELTNPGFVIYTWYRRWGAGVANPDAVRVIQVNA